MNIAWGAELFSHRPKVHYGMPNAKKRKIFWFDDGYSYVYLTQRGNILHEATDSKTKH
jgi:hypothetical protein